MKRGPILLVAIVLAACVLGAAVLLTGGDTGAVDAGATPERTATPRGEPESAALTDGGAAVHGREQVPALEGTSPSAAEVEALPVAATELGATAEEVLLHGRVLDVRGVALGGVGVGPQNAKKPLGVSDGAGAFSFPVDASFTGRLEVVGEGFATVCAARIQAGGLGREQLVVAAPAIDLWGVVVDPDGVAISGAQLRLEVNDELLREFPLALDGTVRVPAYGFSDGDGRFGFDGLASPPNGLLRVAADGFVPADLAVPTVSRDDLRIALERADAARQLVVEGVVLRADRSPAAQAQLYLANQTAQAGAEGRFRFELPQEPLGEGTSLAAALKGSSPVIVRDFDAIVNVLLPEPPPFQELVLGPELWIEGRVLAADGSPRANWVVSFAQGVELSRYTTPPTLLEGLAVGSHHVPRRRTDAEGRFRLDGLADRDYVVRAWDSDTLLSVRSEPLRPSPEGTEVELRLAPDTVLPRVAGRVVTRTGLPVANARVVVEMAEYRTRTGYSSASGAETVTDDDGAFELLDVPASEVWLDLSGDAILPAEYHFDDGAHPESLVVSVPARCHFRPELSGESREFHLRVFDDAENQLSVYRIQGNSWSSTTQVPLKSWTGVLSTSEDARTWALVRAGSYEEVARGPLGLVPGAVTPLELP